MPPLSDAKPLVQSMKEGSKSSLYYGPPGTWKTTLATKHPGRLFWIDVDEKIHEMEHLPVEDRERITVWQPGESLVPGEVMIANIDRTRKNVAAGTKIPYPPRGYRKVVEVLNELLKLAKDASPEKPFPYDCVVLDSLTRLMNHLEYL